MPSQIKIVEWEHSAGPGLSGVDRHLHISGIQIPWLEEPTQVFSEDN